MANAFGREPYFCRKLVGSERRIALHVFEALTSACVSFAVLACSFFSTQLPKALLRSAFVP